MNDYLHPDSEYTGSSRRRRKKTLTLVVTAVLLLALPGFAYYFFRPVFRASNLQISPPEIVEGENAIFSVDFTNTGRSGGTCRVSLMVDGEEIYIAELRLEAGEKEAVRYILPGESAGEYTVEFGGLTGSYRVLEPPDIKIDTLEIRPNPLPKGEEATVTVLARNSGEAAGEYPVSLTVDGVVEYTETVLLEGGAEKQLDFTLAREEPGCYQVGAGGLLETMRVVDIRRPASGTVIKHSLRGGEGVLKIENGLKLDALAVLADPENPKKPLLCAYIRAGETHSFSGIKNGTYKLYVAKGLDWDAHSGQFTREMVLERFTDDFKFAATRSETKVYYDRYTVTLHPVPGGEAVTEAVAEDDFPWPE